jgi:N-acetylglucosaminyl-diphospho-decaprenol L-rhamnosyltransferase
MRLTLSVVSHGHSSSILSLLKDINDYSGSLELVVFLTWNAPELETKDEQALKAVCKWPITIIKNHQRKGFGQNHNAALQQAGLGIWCVINPDLRFAAHDLEELVSALSLNDVGLAFPRQADPNGVYLDYRRELVTPWSLIKRYIGQQVEQLAQPDWVSGCFMAFRSEVYQELGGFDESFFLYCEDVDLCLRLQLAGYKMMEVDFSIIHDTRRGTLKKWAHFKWHVRSLLRLWCSRAFWAYLRNRSKISQQ